MAWHNNRCHLASMLLAIQLNWLHKHFFGMGGCSTGAALQDPARLDDIFCTNTTGQA
jgi:hypothetical protein